MATNHTRWYVGAVDDIATIVDGREVVVSHGQPVEVSAASAAALDAQPANWSDRDPRSFTAANVKAVLATVGDDPVLATEALAVERGRGAGSRRETLVQALEERLAAYHAGPAAPPVPAGVADPEITEPAPTEEP